MLVWLIISAVIGGIVALISGHSFLFWVVSIALFIFGLPGILIGYLFDGGESYRQDREDDRELMREINEGLRESERENKRELRHLRYLDHLDYLEEKREINTYNIDARSIHYHKYPKPSRNPRSKQKPESSSEPPLRDEKGRFIKKPNQ